MKTTQINPYLNFNGKCREAMQFYKSCLGGELTMQRVAESPMSATKTSQDSNHILHSTLVSDRIVLMGSDMIGNNLQSGNSISLCMVCFSDEEINKVFSMLAEGGNVKTPLHQTFWGATHGELTDRYGFNWVFNFSKN
ncbi:MAG: VOC family protein [Cyclobacteriaceae bacterium]|nr:VOC family protein [Cyclobacteriaceae bacterium]